MSDTNIKTRPKIKDNVKIREKVQNPKNYKVVLMNNPITDFDAVVDVLRTVFLKSNAESIQIMWYAHNYGFALVMISTKEICEQKVQEARNYCLTKQGEELQGRNRGYQHLQFEVEEDENNS
jgi:ATP-dependent Clp protease adaptor protein ClpS